MTSSSIHHSPFTIRNSPVSALLFDFGGTLDAEGVAWKDRFYRLWSEEQDIPREGFNRAFYAADDALVGAVAETLPLEETVARLARAIASELRNTNGGIAGRVSERFCEDARKNLAESAAILERLSGRFALGVVSNFYGNLGAVCREAGLSRFLRTAVDSARVGCCKPEPAIFRAALADLDAEAGSTLFVGDSPERDMAGAKGVGMRHALLAGDSAEKSRAGCCPGDPVLRRLAELENLL